MIMKEKLQYANQWDVSAQHFYSNGYYSWMADKLFKYKTILEIGCGTGYSTLALLQKGYFVIAVDKNSECIKQAKELIISKGYTDQDVVFFEGDIAIDKVRFELIKKYEFDVVICWNVGTYWNEQMINHYLPYMYEYGLNNQQIYLNLESSYAELILWDACRLANAKGAACHIIDRGKEIINEKNDPYYYALKDEFSFSKIEYDHKYAETISSGGRILVTNGKLHNESKINVIFISVLYT